MALSSAGAKTDTMEVVWCVRVFYHLSLPLTYMQFSKSAIDKKNRRTLPTLCEDRAQSWSLDKPWRTVIRVLTDDRCRNQSDFTLDMVQRSLGTFPRSIFSAPWTGERELQNNFWSVPLKIIKKILFKTISVTNKTTLTCSVFATKWSIFSDFCWVNHTAVSLCFHRGSLGKFNSCMARQ